MKCGLRLSFLSSGSITTTIKRERVRRVLSTTVCIFKSNISLTIQKQILIHELPCGGLKRHLKPVNRGKNTKSVLVAKDFSNVGQQKYYRYSDIMSKRSKVCLLIHLSVSESRILSYNDTLYPVCDRELNKFPLISVVRADKAKRQAVVMVSMINFSIYIKSYA